MKKIINLVLLILLGTFSLFAQDAKSILDQLAKTTKSYKTMEGIFQYKLENKEANLYENSEGTFLIKGDKYVIDVLGAKTYYDGKNLYSYIKDVNEVSIQTPPEGDENFLSPANIFTIYQKGYDYNYVGKEIANGKSLDIIDLLPKTDDKNYKKLTIKIDSKTHELYSIKSYGKSGDNVEIEITSMKKNSPIPDSRFTFNTKQHPDVEVIDMR